LARTLESFFETKTGCDVDGTMAYFSPGLATYTDATLGWDLDSYEALEGIFSEYMPNWAPRAGGTPRGSCATRRARSSTWSTPRSSSAAS